MQRWLLAVLTELNQVPITCVVDNGRRMISVLSIILCFARLLSKHISMDTISCKDIASMLAMLCLHPDVERKQCLDYDYISKLLNPDVKKSLSDIIAKICVYLHRRTFLTQPQWLKAVPLLHFLQGVTQPFAHPELDATKIKWVDASLDLYQLRQQTYEKNVK